MKTKAFILTCAMVISVGARAASVPWVGLLDSTHPISVPAGKILVVEHIVVHSTGPNPYLFTISGSATGGIGNGAFSVTIPYQCGPISSPNLNKSSFKLGPGMTLGYSGNSTFSVLGVAMDTGDFFAAINPVIRSVSAEDSQLAAVVDSRTAIPTQTTGEVSTDLQTWSTTGAKVTKSASNPRISKVTTEIDGSKKLLRATQKKKAIASTTN